MEENPEWGGDGIRNVLENASHSTNAASHECLPTRREVELTN